MNRKSGMFSFLRKGNNKEMAPRIKSTYYIGGSSAQSRMWRDGSYYGLAKEGFMGNVIVNRSLSMIARNASSVGLLVYTFQNNQKLELPKGHPIVQLLSKPNQKQSSSQFIESMLLYFLLCGNAYVYAVTTEDVNVGAIELLRPDRVLIKPNQDGNGALYEYSIDGKSYAIEVRDNDTKPPLLHLKNFHPLDDQYGFSSLQAAEDIVAQYNECVKWNRSLVQNGARPSGAIVVKGENGTGGSLTDEQFEQIRSQLRNHSGEENAGKVLILEGGLDWKEMSVSPKDMEFLETKNGAARDIALSLGVPPQLLGIKGDNTYNNIAQARLALWEETVLPLLTSTLSGLSQWLSKLFNMQVEISYDPDTISALSERRSEIWSNVKDSEFVTEDEKRDLLGFGSNKSLSKQEEQTANQPAEEAKTG